MMELKKQRMGMGTAEIVIIILILFAANYLGYKFFTRFDMTQNKQYTISKATKSVLSKLTDPVTVEFFLSSDLPPQIITMRDEAQDKLAEYVAYSGGKLKLRYIDPGSDTTKKDNAGAKGVRETQVQVVEHDQASVKNVFFGLAMSYEDKTESIPFINIESLEYDLTSKLVKMTMTKKPKIGVFAGPMTFNQQQPPSYNGVQGLLGGQDGMYDVVQIDPKNDQVLPPDLDGVFILGAFGMSDAMKYSLDQFIMKGGKAVIAIDPMMKAGQQQGMPQMQAYPSLPTLEDQLQTYGVRFTKQLIADKSCASVQMQNGIFMVSQEYPLFPMITPEGLNKDVSAVGKLESMIMPYCCPLDEIAVKDVKFISLAKTSEKSFTINSPFDLTPMDRQQLQYAEKNSATKGPYNVIAMLEGKIPTAFPAGPPAPAATPPPAAGEAPPPPPPSFDASQQLKAAENNARVVVMSSAAALTDDFLKGSQGNMMYLNNVADMLLMGDDLLNIRNAPTAQRPLRLLSDAQKGFYRWLNVLGVPVLLVLFGLALWMLKGKRRRAIQAKYAE
jgi:ABC-2 type transport system permease protein